MNRLSLHCFTAFLWLLLMGAGAHNILLAQANHQPYFRNYNTDDGLPSPEVHDIIQDNKGYLWIATDNGVSRFDGYQFKNFGAKEGLNNNVVFCLQVDEQDRVWMQTMSGNVYYHFQDSIYPYRYNKVFQKYHPYLPQGFIMSENTWSYFVLSDLGILKIDPQGNHEVINKDHDHSLILLEQPELEQTLFSVVSNSALEKFGFRDLSSASLLKLAVYSDSLMQEQQISVERGDTRSSGYSDKIHQLFDLRKELFVFFQHKLQAHFPLPAKAAIITKKDATFWLGLNDKYGVWSFSDFTDLKEATFKQYLLNNSISAVCKDKLGGYWFGSLENGIFYAPNIELEVIERPGVSPNEQILSLERGQGDQLLMGTDEGNLYVLDATSDIRKLSSGNSAIYDLHYTKNEAIIWVTGRPFRIFDSGKTRELSYAPELSVSNVISGKKLHLSRDSSYLYSLTGIGLEVIDMQTEQVIFTTFKTASQERFLHAFEDYDNRLWIGSTRGLLQFKDQQFIPPPINHPVFGIRIEAIDQLPDSTLILGSKGSGVVFWKDSILTIIDENDGLTSNMIETLTIDERQQIWVGTLNGLNMLSRPEGQGDWKVKKITMAHGLPSNEIHDLCSIDSLMYVATARGLVKFPLYDDTKADLTRPFLESVMVNGKLASPASLNGLTHNERNIQIQFVCLNFKFKENVPYRYRLTSEPEWSYTLDRNVNYAALAPGTYVFEVQAQNEDGAWSSSLCLPFSISSPLWQRWWFLFLAAASLIGLVYYWYRLRLSRLKKEAGIEREINDLQRAALQAQMNPHFIFNCLNSIQNFIASGNKDSAMEYLSRFANLVRTTLNTSIEAAISLQEEIQVLENYLELEKLRFGNRFNYDIQLDRQLDVFDTILPPLLVQPFVENAIIHGFNFEDKTKVGQIYIAYELVDKLLQITIRDNGIGIEQSKRNKAGKEKLRASLGMNITQKRLSLQNDPQEEGYLKINELVDEAGVTCGTEIVIRIKV